MTTDGYGGATPQGTCSGTVTVTFKWHGSGPRPSVVVLDETCVARSFTSAWNTPQTPGNVSNGRLGDPRLVYNFQTNYPPPRTNMYWAHGYAGIVGGTAEDTSPVHHYELIHSPGQTITRTISPTATWSNYVGGGYASVRYRATVLPITIESDYAIRTGNTLNFLIGQGTDFRVVGQNMTFSNWNWSPGHRCIGGVSFGTEHDHPSNEPGFAGWKYKDTRTTNSDPQLNIERPLWFYEGGNGVGRNCVVTCNVNVHIGSWTGAAVVRQAVRVHRPSTRWWWYKSDATIYDTSDTSIMDFEKCRAGSTRFGTPGISCYCAVKLPALFVGEMGEGTWSYVQLISRSYYRDSTPGSDAWGLDNTYPYGYWNSYLSPPTFDKWVTTGPQPRMFQDSPWLGITQCLQYGDDFAAKCFVVLRPPVRTSQSLVDIPVKYRSWTYTSQSARPQVKWQDVSAYASFLNGGQTVWETHPPSGSVQPGATVDPALSEQMDWNHTNLNN